MVALAADRHTQERDGFTREPPVKAATKIFGGSIAAINAAGWAVPATAALNLKVIGRCERLADNSAGADGAINARVRRGVYRFANSAAGDAIARSDIGASCYAVDDQTVAKTDGSGTRSVAGKIFDVDALGVWVEFF